MGDLKYFKCIFSCNSVGEFENVVIFVDIDIFFNVNV